MFELFVALDEALRGVRDALELDESPPGPTRRRARVRSASAGVLRRLADRLEPAAAAHRARPIGR